MMIAPRKISDQRGTCTGKPKRKQALQTKAGASINALADVMKI